MPTAHAMALRRLLLLLLVLHVALAITFDTPALPSSLPQLLALASSGDAEGAAALLEAGQLTAAEFATVNSGCFRLAPRRHR